MCEWQKYTVLGLVVCLMYLPMADVGLAASDTPLPNPSLTRQQVEQLGVGAKVKVELASGQKLNGSIQSVEEDGFLLASSPAGPPTRVAFDQVSELKLAKITYNAKGNPDPAEARRVAAGLGVGHHVVVKTMEGREYHGNIVSLGAESFTMLPDHQAAPVQIAYCQTQQLGPNMSTGTKIAIIVLVGVAITVTIIAVWFSENVH